MPNPNNRAKAREQAIVRTAAEWRTRQDAGLLPGEKVELTRWLEQDCRHAEIFSQMDSSWGLLDRVREISPSLLDEPLPPAGLRRHWGNALWASLALAAAAAVVVLGIGKLRRVPANAGPFAETVSSDPGLAKRLNLPDGSTVRMNADTTLAVEFTGAERDVRLLRGEAHFDVAKNPRRPFLVSADGVVVRAVGTAFDVRLGVEAVEILVDEGKVRVEDAARGGSLLAGKRSGDVPLLVAGEKAVVRTATAARPEFAVVVELAPAELGSALAWQEHRLEFVSTPLGEIVAQFNRYNQRRLKVSDPALAGLRLGGSFRADDPETFVHLLETRSDVVVEREADETVIRSAP